VERVDEKREGKQGVPPSGGDNRIGKQIIEPPYAYNADDHRGAVYEVILVGLSVMQEKKSLPEAEADPCNRHDYNDPGRERGQAKIADNNPCAD